MAERIIGFLMIGISAFLAFAGLSLVPVLGIFVRTDAYHKNYLYLFPRK